MITCILGLTACGSAGPSEYDQWKLDNAENMAATAIIPFFQQCTDDAMDGYFDDYTNEEIAYILENQVGLMAEGNAVTVGIESFKSAIEVMGGILEVGTATAEFDKKSIIVQVEVIGVEKNAIAEVIVSNDMFMKLESASLNPESTVSELMGKAALNTLIGMGTVFSVLLLICLIISCFSLISKVQKAMENKTKATENTGIDNAVAQITAQEEVADETDDLELVAVIAAAIAASEGKSSTDGFVVRSIRRRV